MTQPLGHRDDACAVFQYEPTKTSDAVVAELVPSAGTLTADGEHRFNTIYETGRVIETGCNAHGRRKFRDAKATQPVLATEGGALIAAMYIAEEEAKTAASSATRARTSRHCGLVPPQPLGRAH
jgi:hypothetical protein